MNKPSNKNQGNVMDETELACRIRRLWWEVMGYDPIALADDIVGDPPTDADEEINELSAAVRLQYRSRYFL